MKKTLWIASLVLGTIVVSENVLADSEITYETCTGCSSCGTKCRYINNNGKVTVYGPTQTNPTTGQIPEGSYTTWDFFNNYDVTEVEFKGNITSIGYNSFYTYGRSNLSKVTLPESLKTIGSEAFVNSAITEITIPKNVTTISNGAFRGSTLQNVTFEEGSHLTTVERNAFGHTNLKNVVLPYGVTTIGDNAFNAAMELESLVIPSSVNSIGAVIASRNCKILIEGTLEQVSSNAFVNSGGVYCMEGANCEAGLYSTQHVNYFTKTDGVYQKSADGTYFASAELMLADKGGDKACKSIDECKKIIAAANAKQMFIVGGKFYNSLNDWVKGTYNKKRIYTIQEANQVSAPTGNRVSLRYK